MQWVVEWLPFRFDYGSHLQRLLSHLSAWSILALQNRIVYPDWFQVSSELSAMNEKVHTFCFFCFWYCSILHIVAWLTEIDTWCLSSLLWIKRCTHFVFRLVGALCVCESVHSSVCCVSPWPIKVPGISFSVLTGMQWVYHTKPCTTYILACRLTISLSLEFTFAQLWMICLK